MRFGLLTYKNKRRFGGTASKRGRGGSPAASLRLFHNFPACRTPIAEPADVVNLGVAHREELGCGLLRAAAHRAIAGNRGVFGDAFGQVGGVGIHFDTYDAEWDVMRALGFAGGFDFGHFAHVDKGDFAGAYLRHGIATVHALNRGAGGFEETEHIEPFALGQGPACCN